MAAVILGAVMSGNSANLPRLFVDAPLSPGAAVPLAREQAHYLVTVLRKAAGEAFLAFNGHDGEWRCVLDTADRKRARARAEEMTRAQTPLADLHLLFAPLKKARIDYLAQKATEMGAAVLRPVLTRYTVADRVRTDRLRANAVEAAEQCNLLAVPEVREPEKLMDVLAAWPDGRRLLFCDEALAGAAPPADALRALPDEIRTAPWAVLIGPEGGFDETERRHLHALPQAHPVALGPRVMRADTAAVAALALWQSVLGDWR